MRICSFKIKNYKSFLEPRELILEEGFNLIVGQNNVGKTALLEALSLGFIGKPQTPIAVEQVNMWLTSKGGSAKYLSTPQQSIAVTDPEWLRRVDGANLLIDLFQDLSGARHIYNKTDHSVQLTEWLLKNDPGVLQELKTFLVEILSAEGQAA